MVAEKEADLKAKVLAALRAERRISRDAVIANEFRLNGTSVRADLAILDTEFICVEVKSHSDSLRRLERQLSTYRLYFDSVVLAVASKHVPGLQKFDLRGVEIWEIDPLGRVNVSQESLTSASEEKRALTDLLTKTDMERAGCRPNEALGDARAAFRRAFHRKFGPTSFEFWKATSRRGVRASDIALLSRYQPGRQHAEERQRAHQAQLLSWSKVPMESASLSTLHLYRTPHLGFDKIAADVSGC